jgi:hypothetical protein
MLDPDPDEMNADPQPWIKTTQEHLKVCRTLSAGRRNTVPSSCNWFSNSKGVQNKEEDITDFAFCNAMAHIFDPLHIRKLSEITLPSSYFFFFSAKAFET